MSAADRAAEQVETIVASAQAAAAQIRADAEREAEEIRAAARRDAEAELERSRNQALEFDADTRRGAQREIDEAHREAREVRQQTRRAVEGRVEAAEAAAARVLEEAEALSRGLRQLGELLGERGERILRDVQEAHRGMRAELRVGPPEAEDEQGPAKRRRPSRGAAGGEDLELPGWLESDDG